MPLHLVIPGLLWSRDSLRETCRDLSLPALSTVLGRGERSLAPARTLLDFLAASFGLSGEELPWAALRLAGEDRPPGDAIWLCADPSHLRFARDTLVLVDATELDISGDEAGELVASLNRHFSDVGAFHMQTPQRWYLRVAAPPQIRTRPLEAVIGRSFDAFLPEGPDATRWRALLNEVQMLLHGHPVNAAREAAGKPPINSAWLWGAGRMPTGIGSIFSSLLAEDPIALGLAHAAGIDSARLPAHGSEAIRRAAHGAVLAVIDTLRAAALHRDASAWRSGLVELERQWFAPLLEAIYGGQLRELRVTAPGDEATLEVTLAAQDRWKFWRRPVSLGELDRAAAAP